MKAIHEPNLANQNELECKFGTAYIRNITDGTS